MNKTTLETAQQLLATKEFSSTRILAQAKEEYS